MGRTPKARCFSSSFIWLLGDLLFGDVDFDAGAVGLDGQDDFRHGEMLAGGELHVGRDKGFKAGSGDGEADVGGGQGVEGKVAVAVGVDDGFVVAVVTDQGDVGVGDGGVGDVDDVAGEGGCGFAGALGRRLEARLAERRESGRGRREDRSDGERLLRPGCRVEGEETEAEKQGESKGETKCEAWCSVQQGRC